MNSGYIKFWRKAQCSASWNRGLMYQGLMINILCRANWKPSSYQGQNLEPGQFGVVLGSFAESVGVARSTLRSMLAKLVDDEFITVTNFANRFVVISINNWGVYQPSQEDLSSTNGQRTVNDSSTNGQRTVNLSLYKEEEGKKERININTPPPPPQEGGERERKRKASSHRPASGNSIPELRAKIEAYTDSQELRQSLEAFRVMRERIRKPLTGRGMELSLAELDKLAGGDTAIALAIVDQSVQNSWQGLFPLKGSASPRAGWLDTNTCTALPDPPGW